MTRLLVLSVSAGNGHVRAAQALVEAANRRPGCSAVHVDAMAHVARGFRKLYTEGYVGLVNRAPELWSYLHGKSDRTPHGATLQRLRRGIERISAGALLREVRRVRPDAIVCTHFLPAELLMREARQGRLGCPVWLQVTDYDLHNMWLVPGLAGYLAATPEVAYRMRSRGLDPQRVHVTGIPVMAAFSGSSDAAAAIPAAERDACVARLGLDPGRPVVLMSSGGAVIGDLAQLVRHVLSLDPHDSDFQVIAVAGRNVAAHRVLSDMAACMPRRLLAIGFTDDMAGLMRAADLVVTKPGGLTVSECMALGKPMLLVSPIPGQEENNATYLLEQGAAWLAGDSIGLAFKLQRLMSSPSLLARMARCSAASGRPDAARHVLDQVLGGLQAEWSEPLRRRA